MLSPIERWRLRHAYPDAVGLWAVSTGRDARALAFSAIAQDPRVLQRAARNQAIRLVAQAEEFTSAVAEALAADSDAWRAATLLVRRTIEAWRNSRRTFAVRPDEPGAPSAPAPPRAHDTDPWEIARHNFPCVDDATGRLATRLLHEFGEALLNRARKPWDQLITLAALRHAARLLRGELHEGEAADTGAGPVADVLSLQAYAQRNGLAPMLVGYTGPGRPAVQALGLLRDARTLRDAVAAAGPGATDRADVWQRAIDFHAFAIVALDPRMLLELPMEEAYEIAAAAIRQADVAQRSPDSEIWPLLPPGCACSPQVVRLHALACLPPDRPNEKYPASPTG